jgi:hypothetical protein
MWLMKIGDEKCSGNQAVLKRWQKCFGDPMFRITGDGRFFSLSLSLSLSVFFIVYLPKAEDTYYTPGEETSGLESIQISSIIYLCYNIKLYFY